MPTKEKNQNSITVFHKWQILNLNAVNQDSVTNHYQSRCHTNTFKKLQKCDVKERLKSHIKWYSLDIHTINEILNRPNSFKKQNPSKFKVTQ